MLLKTATFCMLLSLSVASKGPFTSNEDEYIYNYIGKIKTFHNDPDFSSYFKIHADLHISPIEDGLWMTLKNVAYEVYSGNSNSDETEEATLPKDSESINIPFIYHRYKNESQYGITVHKDDMPWSKNMKQAIANLIFMNSRAFDVKVPTEYVHEDQHSYYVFPLEDGVDVQKFKAQEYYDMALEPKFQKHKDEHHILPMIKNEKYVFRVEKDRLELSTIEYMANYDFHPFHGQSEDFFVQIQQELVKKSTAPATEHEKFNRDNMEYIEIDFKPNMFMVGNGVYDFTMGRQTVDSDALITNIKNDLEELLKYSQESHITLSKFHLENKHTVDFLIYRLKNLDTDHLSKLYSSISNLTDNKMANVLLQAMSLTGTPNPYSFILDLIAESKLTEDVSIKLLENMPKHVTYYYPNLAKKMWQLIENESTSKKVHNTAILSLSSIYYWSKCSDKIGDAFIQKLNEADTDEQRVLFIHALRNIRCETSDVKLLNVVNDKSMNSHVRAMAMMGLKIDKHLDTLWMNFFDKTEHFEVRFMALHLLTDPQYPDHYDKVYWFLSINANDHFKHFFMKKCENIALTTIERYSKTKVRAREILSSMSSKSKLLFKSSNYLFDYTDSFYGFGSAAMISYYGDMMEHNFTSVHIQFLEKSTSPVLSQNEYYFHIQWTSDKPKKLQNLFDLFGFKYTGCIFDYFSAREDDISSYSSIQLSEDFNILENLKQYLKFDNSNFEIDQSLHTEIVIPTDMGLPLIFFNQKSKLTKTEENTEKMTLYVNYRGNEIYGFAAYNPIANSWNGIRRVQITDAFIPINVDVKPQQKSLYLKSNLDDNPFGFQSYVYNHVFMRSENNDISNIKASCPDCETFSLITEGQEDVENHILWEHDCEHTGLEFKYAVFDCEDHITASHSTQLSQILKTMFNDDNKNFHTLPIMKPILALHHLFSLMTLSPSIGMCGNGLMIKKSQNNPATDVNFILEAAPYQIYMDSNFELSYYLKNGDTLLQSWNATFEYTGNNTENVRKINVKSSKPGKPDYRYCWDINNIFGANQMKSDWTILMGNDHEGKCPEDESKMKISVIAGMNDEMNKMSKTIGKKFTECLNDDETLLQECINQVTSYRSYDVNVEYENISKERMEWWNKISDFFKAFLSNEFVRMEHKDDSAKPGHLRFAIDYPMNYSTINVSVITPIESYRYEHVGYNFYKWLGFTGPFSPFFKYYDYTGVFNYCEAGKDHVRDTEDGSMYVLNYNDNEWSELAQSCPFENAPCVWKVKIMKNPEGSWSDITVHVQFNDDVLELKYSKDLVIVLNGETMPLKSEERFHIGKWIDYMVLPGNVDTHILVHIKNIDLILYYNLDVVKIVLPLLPYPSFGGACDINLNHTKIYDAFD